jgi:glycosyltransferase involved in cell wall biosynthesis
VFDGPVESDIDNYISSIADERIKLSRIEKNGGLASALNYLLGIVLNSPDYKIIARMDADDVSMPERFEKQFNFLEANKEISCVGCWYEEINESGKHLADIRLPEKHEALRRRYYTRTPFAHPSVMYRRELIERAGFYPVDTVLMEDNVLWGKALKAGLLFANLPDFLLKFRKDKIFYKRRSGISYGWHFILTRFKINWSLHFPLYSFVFIFLIGFVKIMPPFLLRYFYLMSGRG